VDVGGEIVDQVVAALDAGSDKTDKDLLDMSATIRLIACGQLPPDVMIAPSPKS